MKRVHWWTLLGVSGAGLGAALLGQAVWGQPGAKGPAPLPPLVSDSLPPAPNADPTLPSLPDLPPPAAPKADVAGQLVPVTKLEKQTIEFSAPSTPLSMPSTPISMPNAPASAPSFPAGKQQPSVSVEWAAPAAIRVRQPMPCQIVVHNQSTTPVHNVVIRHRLNEGVLCKASEPKAVNEGNELTWNLGTLGPNQTHYLNLVLVAQTRGPLNCQATATFTTVAGHSLQVREPQLAVKVRAPDKIVLGGEGSSAVRRQQSR